MKKLFLFVLLFPAVLFAQSLPELQAKLEAVQARRAQMNAEFQLGKALMEGAIARDRDLQKQEAELTEAIKRAEKEKKK